jgi:tetratricopeptide (TPR) repeat protein
LQVAIDWGLPGAALLLIVSSRMVFSILRRRRRGALEAGALGALASVAVHELVDFSIELPVIAMMTIAILAILSPASVTTPRESGRPRESGKDSPNHARIVVLRFGLLCAATLICLVASSRLGTPARAESIGENPTNALLCARDAVERHPADSLWLGRAARAALELRDSRAPALVARALQLNPNHSGIHELAATILARSQRPSQAAVEFAEALRFANAAQLGRLLAEIGATFPEPEQAALALPTDLPVVYRVLTALADLRWDQLQLAYLARVVMLNPDDYRLQLARAEVAIRTRHADIARQAATTAFRLRRGDESAVALARADALVGEFDEGLKILRGALTDVASAAGERTKVLLAAADLELWAGHLDALAETLDELAQTSAGVADQIEVHKRRAELDERRGDYNQADWERTQIRMLQKNGLP